MRKPTVNFRVVCPNFGTTGHKTHVHAKKDEAACDEAIERLDRQFEHRAKAGTDNASYAFLRGEIGWTKESRIIGPWEDINAN